MSTLKLTKEQREVIWRSVSHTLAEGLQAKKRHLEKLAGTIIENHILNKEDREFVIRNFPYIYQSCQGGQSSRKQLDLDLEAVLVGGTNYFALTNRMAEEALMGNEATWRTIIKALGSINSYEQSLYGFPYRREFFANFEKENEYKNVRERYHAYLKMFTRIYARFTRYVGPLDLRCFLSRQEYEFINTYGVNFAKEVYEWASRNYFKNSFALEFINKLREFVEEIFKVGVQLVATYTLIYNKVTTGEELQAFLPGTAGLVNKLRIKGDIPKEPKYQIAPLAALEVSAKLKNLFKEAKEA